jgi:hypothetical protein
MRKLMACLVMVGCCHAAVAGDATSVPPVDSTTAGINTTKPGITGVTAPLVGQAIQCAGHVPAEVIGYAHVSADGVVYARVYRGHYSIGNTDVWPYDSGWVQGGSAGAAPGVTVHVGLGGVMLFHGGGLVCSARWQ